MTTQPKTVLVLCTGNSCCSQMAEVILNHDLARLVRALSAAFQPQPKVADNAIAICARLVPAVVEVLGLEQGKRG